MPGEMWISPLNTWYVFTLALASILSLLQAHSDVFGGDFDGDNIDSVGMDYESKYDDFM